MRVAVLGVTAALVLFAPAASPAVLEAGAETWRPVVDTSTADAVEANSRQPERVERAGPSNTGAQSTRLVDWALFLLRLMIAVLFATSGWSHARKPQERSESMGMSPAFTVGLGVVEMLGAGSLALGIYPQMGALLLIGVMLGAIQKKAFVWRTGFWGDEGQGWYYDLLYLVCNLVVLTTGGGSIRIT